MPTSAAAAEADQARAHLAATRDAVLAHCASLTPGAWHAADGPGRWSPAQILEHLILVEDRVVALLHGLLEQPPEPDWRERTAAQESKLAASATPTQRVEAPPPLHPQGRKAPAEMHAAFAAVRKRTIELVAQRADLEQRVRRHMALGELNGWQWVRLIGYHTERHLKQMQAIGA